MFTFEDRLGNKEILSVYHGETISQALLRHFIPASSVIILCDNKLVPESSIIEDKLNYVAILIEGYDISSIRHFYTRVDADNQGGIYNKKHLDFNINGSVSIEGGAFSLDELGLYIENMVIDTIKHYSLINSGDGILVGLSGGVDSSALLMILTRIKERIPDFKLAAVTFEDYDNQSSPTYQHAKNLASELGVEHHIASAGLAETVFNLNTPLNVILPKLMYTDMAHFAMYIDHHTTRRTLEVFAKQKGLNLIALGLHTTDLVAGLINAWMTGYQVGGIPLRKYSDFAYIYPLAFIQKKELHMYYYLHKKEYARHTYPNPWELNPKDRNFYYYLADQLQTYWPQLEVMLYSAHKQRRKFEIDYVYTTCENCGAEILNQGVHGKECDVCQLLRKAGYIKS